ncbi:MAG: serine/threonine-protein kinase [Bacteroidales bacterium]|nr:serine/threonine-protein kinase [Bacteroidales bacterium]MDD2205446.1 serine/threonine-protein kinase [Bacteroidales bacterium]MDD3914110.1 serine/threonine-protein kinase [Bacteroidales bacterium]MDD4634062.1 serine/threonine-protein kinase [Bacteroidales bacterium]
MSQLQEDQLFANRYRLLKRLGSGAFSEVWKAEDVEAGNLVVAIKIYAPDKGMDEDGVKIFSQEFAIVFNVSHQNLLRPNYFDKNNGSPFLVLPFCENGSALKLIGNNPTEEEVVRFLHDVSAGLAYLHKQNPPIIHQDIKPDNILIDINGDYKLTDFGISTRIRSTLRRSVGNAHSAGTMAYMAPERFGEHNQPVKASDIWSLGATVYEIMCEDAPFGELGGVSLKSGAEIPEVKGNYSPELKQLVENCLAKDPWNRPTAEEIRKKTELYLATERWYQNVNYSQEKETKTHNSAEGTKLENVKPLDEGQSGTGWIIAGYIFALLGGWFGLAIGISIATGKERTTDGQRILKYKKSTRNHGWAIFVIGVISMIIWNIALA